jgi:hypothetical protein
MFENRIRDYVAVENSLGAVVGAQFGFVPCPTPLLATFSAQQQAFVAEIYRRAVELTQAQLQKPKRRRFPAFSCN